MYGCLYNFRENQRIDNVSWHVADLSFMQGTLGLLGGWYCLGFCCDWDKCLFTCSEHFFAASSQKHSRPCVSANDKMKERWRKECSFLLKMWSSVNFHRRRLTSEVHLPYFVILACAQIQVVGIWCFLLRIFVVRRQLLFPPPLSDCWMNQRPSSMATAANHVCLLLVSSSCLSDIVVLPMSSWLNLHWVASTA